MDERHTETRDKVLFGGVASDQTQAGNECVVRDISDHGARIEFTSGVPLPNDAINLRIARKGRDFLARVIWWRDNIIGVAFTDPADQMPVSDIETRLRQSEKKKRQLQRQIDELLGQ